MTETKLADLVGLAEIAERRGVNRNVASGWTRKHDFPRPKHQLRMGPMWDWNEVQAYLDGVHRVTITDPSGKLILSVVPVACPTCKDGSTVTPTEKSLFLDWQISSGSQLGYQWQHKTCGGWGDYRFAATKLSKEDK